MLLPFSQVDVFSPEPLRGNPVAVVHGAGELSTAQMRAFARWTNLSETTFLLPPTTPDADYRLRIFTPAEELPFAGHPTLGSAHAWLQAAGTPQKDRIVQECGAGLVELRTDDDRLAFAAPPLVENAALSPDESARVVRALGVEATQIVATRRLANGPRFIAVQLNDAAAVLALDPDLPEIAALAPTGLGVVGAQLHGADTAVEVRVFCPGIGVAEDPVTGSFNAALAQWLTADLPSSYVAAQGTAIGRSGRVHVTRDEYGAVWIGGQTTETVRGVVEF